MTLSDASLRFAALSHETRLAIFRTLIAHGEAGLPSGTLSKALGVSPSNMSAHLNALNQAGLVRVRKEGRSRIYAIELAAIGALVHFLIDDCCMGHPEVCAPLLQVLESQSQYNNSWIIELFGG